MAMNRIAIIGGGPGGLMLARLLQRYGRSPVVFERDTHVDERPQGGSLDLHSQTGQYAMRQAGLEIAFAAASRPEDQGDRLYDADGTLLFDRDDPTDDRPEIDRTALRNILLEALLPGTVRWGCRVAGIIPSADGFVLVGEGWTEQFDVVVGADGAWSQVRPLLSDAKPAYEGVTLVELGFDVARHPAINRLTGSGKMFAVGDNRALITQRNGLGHIRGYAGVRLAEATAKEWRASSPEQLQQVLQDAFAGWAPMLREVVETGDVIGVRPLYALPIGHQWKSRVGLTLLGDAAHLMSPFSGEGVNLALADAVDLAGALTSDGGWTSVTRYERTMSRRAAKAAEGAAQGLNGAFSSEGVMPVLEHYRARIRRV
ncbi:FAD-dependent oxidoreductase [Gluconobacter frateurii]|nr:NAD(P)/FAD-dependent oxidoreductase [Gluconobacter frateurii]GLP91917.1 FAD-dependent oxidoreductase [Gluconobacter frateurii]